jgi:hypothetical protein
MDGEPRAVPPVDEPEPADLVAVLRPHPWRAWAVVVTVGVPLMLVLVAGLDAIGANSMATALGANTLVMLIAVRGAGIHGAGSWLVAWLVIFGLAGVLGLLLLPWDMPG